MKKVFRYTGWALFVFITFLLMSEYSGIYMYDTCLFSLNGQSVGLQGADVYDLSPNVMEVIYFIVLTANLISIKLKKDYFVTNFTNFILSIPIFLVLNSYVLYYPPFGNTEGFVWHIFGFLLFAYISVVALIAIVVWKCVNNIRLCD